MLSDTLLSTGIVEKLSTLLDNSQLKQLVSLLSSYHSGMWLYPRAVKRKIGLTTALTYEVLHEISSQHLINGHYKLLCDSCNNSAGGIYETINELPETFYCKLCHDELPSIENAVLIYKVI